MNIKQLRVLRGLKQKELADKMGISAQQLNNYEGGQSNPGNKILPALADALGVSTAYLRGDAQQFTLARWQDDPPMTVDEIASARWVDSRGEDAIMYRGLPRILVGGEFGRR